MRSTLSLAVTLLAAAMTHAQAQAPSGPIYIAAYAEVGTSSVKDGIAVLKQFRDAVRKEDGKLHSTELRIFPDIMRGVGEGQRPMNDPHNQTMTNATVTGTAIVGGSNTIKVKFTGGESELVVGPGVPVIAIVTADRSMVKAGVKVRVQGARTADGAVANRITLQ